MKKTEKREKPTLSKNIIARRKALGWTGHKLAEEANIPYPTLRDIEAGISGGQMKTREAIAMALGCGEPELHLPPERILGRLREAPPLSPDQVEAIKQAAREAIKEEMKPMTVASPKRPYLSTKASKLLKIFDRLTPEGQDIILRQARVALTKYALPLKGAE